MRREQRLADAVVELTDTLVKDFDVTDQVTLLAERCTEFVDVTAAAVMVASEEAGRWTSATAGASADLFDVLTLARLEGPVLGSYRTGEPVGPMGLTGASRRWPAFAAAVQRVGYRQVCSVPIRLREEVLGSVLLLHSEADLMPASEVRLVQTLAAAAAIGHVHEREVRGQSVVVTQLQTALHGRVLIEQAKGILASRLDTDVNAAFELMRGHARRHRRRILEVARHVVENRALPDFPSKKPGCSHAR
ncbi:GAF and ANTAR domain-containing protein [Amycolatopsis orientalis]|uniref:GAF and ANTAR domain-containing protein n=1 Tax=Amycolatopsis orientalis TaxID=31958 RepID=UPI0004017AB1|nr:GAF and ANTAR domain-containing protein [Amycolatopsis orientalis]